jgi:tetratricopeptide (TPR) repeat protein
VTATGEPSGGDAACLDENQILDLLERRLSDEVRSEVEAHLDTCQACRQLVAAATAATSGVGLEQATGPEEPAGSGVVVRTGAKISRYLILRVVGTGGMGIVYAAYDPELDRKVAIKVLRPGVAGSGEAHQHRILREAQSMARLTHPNVVAVYDVGVVGEQVFVVMVFVKGATLRRWLAAEPRPWREALDVLLRAARGLSAAHAAGLVHRDFKPDNVLIGEDGRVLVTDFGLAISAAPGEGSSGEPAAAAGRVTDTGTVGGTPGYMPPEQLAGSVIDARSDVFGFCITLYETLYGERPFAGRSPAEIRDSMLGGRVREPAKSVRIPPWIRRILLQGMHAEPERRPGSMSELVAALERDPAAVRRRALLVSAGVLALAALAFAIGWPLHRQSLVCQGAGEKLAGVWDAERKTAVSAALLASGKPWAGQTWQIVEGALDRFARDWVAMRTEACEATQVRREQSEALLDLRMRCLDQRLEELRGVTDILSRPDDALLTTAARAAQSISPLRACADTEALLAPVPLPADPGVRAEVESLRIEIAKGKALKHAGRYREGERNAAGLVVRARPLGYAPLLAEALQAWAEFLDLDAQIPAAVDALREALWAAESGRDRKRAAHILAELVWEVSAQGRNEPAHEYARHAAALLRGVGGDAEIEATLAGNEGTVFNDEGRPVEGEKLCREAVEKRRAVFGPEAPQYGVALANLGVAMTLQQRHEESLALSEQALAVYEKALGEHHPLYGATLFNIANALRELGRLDEARARAERALVLLGETVGLEHTSIASAEHNLGLIAAAQRRHGDAQRHLERAIALSVKLRGPDSPYVARYSITLAEMLMAQGRHTEALAVYRRAVSIYSQPDGNPLLAARTRSAIGQVLLESKAPAGALVELQLALPAQETNGTSKRELAGTRLALAMALWETGDKARARLAAAQAIDELVLVGPPAKDDLAEARSWLASLEPRASNAPGP